MARVASEGLDGLVEGKRPAQVVLATKQSPSRRALVSGSSASKQVLVRARTTASGIHPRVFHEQPREVHEPRAWSAVVLLESGG